MVEFAAKLDIGHKIYFVYGNPKKNIVIFEATIHSITFFETHTMYKFVEANVVLNEKNVPINEEKKFGFFYEDDVDTGNSLKNQLGLSAFPVFSSKKLCKEYLKRQKALR